MRVINESPTPRSKGLAFGYLLVWAGLPVTALWIVLALVYNKDSLYVADLPVCKLPYPTT